MAVEIQEPNDLPPNAITDDNADRYEVLVYEKSPDAAGIKRLGIAGWKDYLGFNSHKVNNVASYVGMPNDYDWESNSDVPYTGTTVTNQIDALATKLGISQEPGTFNPLYPRFQTVESDVETPTTGLKDRMDAVETDIQSIEEEIGSGGGGSSGSLTARISALEGTVGDSDSGLVKEVNILDTQVQDANTGLLKRTTDIETTLNGSTPGTGLISDVNALQTTVGDSDSGLVKEVATNANNISALQTAINDPTTGISVRLSTVYDDVETPTTGLKDRVANIESSISGVYKYMGNITAVDNETTTTTITVDGTVISISGNVQNGYIYNINPPVTDPDKPYIIINGIKYTRGTNVAYVKPEGSSTGHFDELGTAINVDEINALKTEVAKLDSYFISATIDSSWTSVDIPDGIYQFSCVLGGAATGWNISTFILAFSNGGQSYTQTPIDMSNNFGDYWEFDGDYHLKPKNISTNRKLSIHKIGEV